MASDKDNIVFEKTSFLQGVNGPFIKDLYLKYLQNPKSIPQSWAEFFNGLDENQEDIKKEILGPSWAPKKIFKLLLVKTNLLKNHHRLTILQYRKRVMSKKKNNP